MSSVSPALQPCGSHQPITKWFMSVPPFSVTAGLATLHYNKLGWKSLSLTLRVCARVRRACDLINVNKAARICAYGGPRRARLTHRPICWLAGGVENGGWRIDCVALGFHHAVSTIATQSWLAFNDNFRCDSIEFKRTASWTIKASQYFLQNFKAQQKIYKNKNLIEESVLGARMYK